MTESIPPLKLIERGDIVKIRLSEERFWARVYKTDLTKRLIYATVDNDLLTINLKYGQKIQFPYDEVIQFIRK